MVASEPFLLPFILDLGSIGREAGQLGPTDEDFLLGGSGVDVPEFPVLARVIALHERDALPVRTPLEVLRLPAGETAFGENRLNG